MNPRRYRERTTTSFWDLFKPKFINRRCKKDCCQRSLYELEVFWSGVYGPRKTKPKTLETKKYELFIMASILLRRRTCEEYLRKEVREKLDKSTQKYYCMLIYNPLAVTDFKFRDYWTLTSYHWAAIMGNTTVIRHLRNNQNDYRLTLRDHWGSTPIDIAEELKHESAVIELREAEDELEEINMIKILKNWKINIDDEKLN